MTVPLLALASHILFENQNILWTMVWSRSCLWFSFVFFFRSRTHSEAHNKIAAKSLPMKERILNPKFFKQDFFSDFGHVFPCFHKVHYPFPHPSSTCCCLRSVSSSRREVSLSWRRSWKQSDSSSPMTAAMVEEITIADDPLDRDRVIPWRLTGKVHWQSLQLKWASMNFNLKWVEEFELDHF